MAKFVPVVVNKGRKFRGEAYDVGCEAFENYYKLPGWSGRGGMICSCSVKLWSPTKGWVWANPNYVETRTTEVPVETISADKAKYENFVVDSTVEWCKSKSAGKPESEVLRFAHSVIRKHHPELLGLFSQKYNYQEDIVAIVNSTMDWAFRLGYSNAKNVRLAVRVLAKKGLIDREEVRYVANMYLDLKGLHRLGVKYIPIAEA